MTTILVTGGAGYIGSHAVLALKQAGYEVIVLDNLSNGHRELVEVMHLKLIVGDMSDRPLLDKIFTTHNIAAVMHFAAYIAVGESVTDPAKYYHNNVTGTLTLLEAMLAASINSFYLFFYLRSLWCTEVCADYRRPSARPHQSLRN